MTQVTVELKNANLDLLAQAMTTLGYQPYRTGNMLTWSGGFYDQKRGTLTVQQESLVNMIKKAYSVTCLEDVARKRRWQLVRKKDNKFSVKKGY